MGSLDKIAGEDTKTEYTFSSSGNAWKVHLCVIRSKLYVYMWEIPPV